MKLLKKIMFTLLLCVLSLNAMAAKIQINTPTVVSTLPTSLIYSNSFTGESAGTTFFDDYTFTIKGGFVDSITASINLDGIFQLSDLRARLYVGDKHYEDAIAPGTLLEGKSVFANQNPTIFSTTAVLTPLSLVAGTYTLQIKGIVAGESGGSYVGILNIAPAVPEPKTYVMLLVGLGLIGFITRHRGNFTI